MYYQIVIKKPLKTILSVCLILAFALILNSCTGGNKWAVPQASSNMSPTAVITGPLAGNISDEGTNVTFTGSAQDPEDDALTGASLVWTSDRDGQIGTGLTFNIAALSRGAHVITLTATDASGATGSASIAVTVRTPWRDLQWGYRQQIVISAAMAQTDQGNFPALIKITNQTNPLFGNALSNGDDILFTDMDGVNKLDHEIEHFRDTGLKELYAWVRIPNLSSSSDTIIYMYYGNGGAVNQENADMVWDSNYLAVWHLAEDPSVSTDCDGGAGTKEVCDSTSNDYDGDSCSIWNCTTKMSSGDQVPGQIGGSLDFDGVNDWIELGTSLVIDTNFTIETWINFRNLVPPAKPSIIGHAWDWHFQLLDSGLDSGRLWFRRWRSYEGRASTTVLSTDRWYHVVVTLTSGTTNNLRFYIDGVLDPIESMVAPVKQFTTWNLRMAREQQPPDIADYDGFLDEMRMSDTVRSPEWIGASFLNQNDPGTGNPLDPDVYTTFEVEEVN